MTKGELRTVVRTLIGDQGALVWADTMLDVTIGAIFDELWVELLDAAVWYNSELETFDSLSEPGYLDLSELTRRLYKMQSVVRDQFTYTSTSLRDIVIEGEVQLVAPNYTYAILAQQLWLYPLDADTPLELRYSYLPTPYLNLSDSDNISWPSGHDSALFFSIVYRLVADDKLQRYAVLAAQAMARLKQAIIQQHNDPAVMYLTGSAQEWGDG